VNLLAKQLLDDFGEIGRKRVAELAKLWPKDLFDKAPRRCDHNRLPVHPAISKQADPIPATKRDEELARPAIRNRESDFLRSLAAGVISEACADAVGSGISRGLLARSCGAGEEGLDLAQLLTQPRFGRGV
jgi:hypothetical protein